MAAEERIKKIANVSRRPSVHRDTVPLVSGGPPKRSYSPGSDDSFGEGPPDPNLLRWGGDDIADWLRETGFAEYEVSPDTLQVLIDLPSLSQMLIDLSPKC